MTRTFVGAMTSLRSAARGSVADGRSQTNPNARYRPPITKFERMKDGLTFWGLRIYIRVLMMIGWASELTANCNRKENR